MGVWCMNRSYKGEPIDATWSSIQDRNFTGDGVTVEVVDDNPVKIECKITLPENTELSHIDECVLSVLCDDGPQTIKKLAGDMGVTKAGVRCRIENLASLGLVEIQEGVAKWGAHLIVPKVKSLKDVQLPNHDRSFFGEDVSELQLTPNQRDIYVTALLNPWKTPSQIANDVGVSQPSVWRFLTDYSDPRNIDPERYESNKRREKLIERRLESLREHRKELKKKLSDLRTS